MRICPQCRTSHSADATRCHRDGTDLVDVEQFLGEGTDPLLGTTIAGRFRLLECIGTGGMGTVYRGIQSGLNRPVALKILKKEVSWDRDAVTRFHREAKAMSLLVHPNTVRVIDFGETEDGLLYLAMELLEGEVLASKSRREGPLEPPEAVRIAKQILASLHEAHAKGLIHRDLKPDNIFLAEVEGHSERVVKVLDFGIAKAWQGDKAFDELETQAGTVFGTPRFMSPEQAQGGKLDPRSDLYSVGILLYQMLVGSPPFVDDDAVVVMAKHIREQPEPLRRAAPQRPLPVSLERVVMRAIEKRPDARFQNAQELIDALDACAGDIAAAARRPRRLHGFPPAALALSASLLAAAAGISGYLLTRAEGFSGHASRGGKAAAPADTSPTGGADDPPHEGPRRNGNEVPPAVQATLVSEPSGAQVWHEGALIGTTPLHRDLDEGERLQVELRKEGYEPAHAELAVETPHHVVELSAEPEHEPRAARTKNRRRGVTRRRTPRSRTEGGTNGNGDGNEKSSRNERRDSPYERFE